MKQGGTRRERLTAGTQAFCDSRPNAWCSSEIFGVSRCQRGEALRFAVRSCPALSSGSLLASPVASRSVGIQTFWFQAICQNHIVWDATEVVEFSRKHTANVHEALDEIRYMVESLVAKRDARRDGFVHVIRQAMQSKLGDDAEEVGKVLAQNGIPRQLAKKAVEAAERQGRFTVFALVDALTRIAEAIVNAGDRTQLDQRASRLLTLAA